MFVFREIGRALFSCDTCFEIRPLLFVLFPTTRTKFINVAVLILHLIAFAVKITYFHYSS